VTVLDVGTGGGDIPRALVRWARRVGRSIRVFALDRDGETLRAAALRMAGYPEITLIRGDALALPVQPRSVDVAISALVLHHLPPAEAAVSLAEMDRAARRGLVANDLFRSRLVHAVVWLTTRLLARNRMTRHDGPMSVRRAYTLREVESLARRADLVDVRVHRYVWAFRLCAVRTTTQHSPRRSSTQPSPQGFALQLELPRLRDQLSPRLASARRRPSPRTAGSVSARTSRT
jgi:ubiquinone/menaquinone biosynthesis C-methylase UbiE